MPRAREAARAPPYQDGLALDPCLDPKHHGKEQQKQAQLEGTIY